MADEAIIVFKDQTSPGLEDYIRDPDGQPVDLTNKTLGFSMRAVDSYDVEATGTPVMDPDQAHNRGKLTYTWQAGDTDVPGEKRFWWTIDGQDTLEFVLVVAEHAPGWGTTGAIAKAVGYYLPATATALVESPSFGYGGVQHFVDTVKSRMTGSIVAARAEVTEYDPLVVDYLAKVATIAIIPKAIDWWGDQRTSVSTSGTSESVSYPERRDQLWAIRRNLIQSVRKCKLVQDDDGRWVLEYVSSDPGSPRVSSEGEEWVTEDPKRWRPLHRRGVFADLLPWRIS